MSANSAQSRSPKSAPTGSPRPSHGLYAAVAACVVAGAIGFLRRKPWTESAWTMKAVTRAEIEDMAAKVRIRPEQLVHSAEALARDGQVDASRTLIDAASVLDPETPDVFALRAVLLASQRDYAGAVTELEQYVESRADGAAIELLSCCRSARDRETVANVAEIVRHLKRRGFLALVRHLESRRAPGLFGPADPSFSDVV